MLPDTLTSTPRRRYRLPMGSKLVFRRRGRRDERPLRGDLVRIGRDPQNDIVLDEADERSVSRFHARIEHDGRHWRISDMRSTNRIRVNGELLPPDASTARALADGDTILLGSVEARFVREADSLVLGETKSGPPDKTVTWNATRLADLPGLIDTVGALGLPREAEGAIERAKKALSALSTVSGRIAAVTPIDDIIEAIMDLVFDVTPAGRAALFLWDDETRRLVPKRARTRDGGDEPSLLVSQSLVRDAFDRRVVALLDPAAKTSDSTFRLNLLSAVAIPLLDETKVIGVIYADSSTRPDAFDPFGVALLSALAGHTAIALEQARLLRKARQEERWRSRLGQYLAPGVVDRLLASGDSSPGFGMKAEEVDVTVMFCDMAGFTARTENMEPHDVLVLLNRCFSLMTEVIQEQAGTVDKYIGDCLMAVFGAPFPQADHARRAALSALGVRDAIREINRHGAPLEVDFRIGMHSGRAVAGDVGHVTRRNWTVLGATVNLASRMESAIARPGQIVLTEETRAGLGEDFELRAIDVLVPPKGFTRGIRAFELLGLRDGS